MSLARVPDEDIEFVLAARRWCTPVVAKLTLEAVDHSIGFAAGQYVLVQDQGRAVPVRSYSIANAPRPSGALTLLVTAVPGGPTSTWLTRQARVGDRLLISGPYGSFLADPDHRVPTLYLAGGSGLAPIKALVEDAVARGATASGRSATRHTLIFSGRTAADVIDRKELEVVAREQPGFEYLVTLTRTDANQAVPPPGRVPDVLPGLLADLSTHTVYIAGSPGFVDACRACVHELGAQPGRLHTEEFYAEPVPWIAHPEGPPHRSRSSHE